jgi:hypothetical protein
MRCLLLASGPVGARSITVLFLSRNPSTTTPTTGKNHTAPRNPSVNSDRRAPAPQAGRACSPHGCLPSLERAPERHAPDPQPALPGASVSTGSLVPAWSATAAAMEGAPIGEAYPGELGLRPFPALSIGSEPRQFSPRLTPGRN